MKRTKTSRTVARRVRIYKTIVVKRTLWQVERPYVLFGVAVRGARKDLDMTQQDLADAMKLSRGSIANIETGRQRILLSDVFDFAKVLKVTPAKFFRAVAD